MIIRILIALLLMTSQAYATVAWRNGTGADTILGTSNASDIDTNTFNNIVSPLDDLLANYQQGLAVTYNSAAQLTAGAGSVTVSNSDGSIRLMLYNSTSTTITWADIDTGAEASATTYYVYAIAASASSTAATFKISTSSTAPSGITYYKRIASFYNDSSSSITIINNDNLISENGDKVSKSTGVSYQATTDGSVCGTITTDGSGTSGYLTGYTDGSSSPSTILGYASAIENSQADHSSTRNSFCMPVKAGDYYKVDIATWAGATYDGTATVYFIPKQ